MEGNQAEAPERRVEASEIRMLFNRSGLFGQFLRGELNTKIEADRPARAELGMPEGTRSQVVRYFGRDGQEIALVHQYLLPDGTIGGSGRPDPKRMILDDEIIYC